MAIIRSYNLPTVESKPSPTVVLSNNAPLGAFGNPGQAEAEARVREAAGKSFQEASKSFEEIAKRNKSPASGTETPVFLRHPRRTTEALLKKR